MSAPTFYLGTHKTGWLERLEVPLFVSRRSLAVRKRLPVAAAPWVLDSGGFSELAAYGEWRTSHEVYMTEVERYAAEIGRLEWVAPRDWMVEPAMLAKTGLTVDEHQRRTLVEFARARERLGELVVPVLQGWSLDDYLRHVEAYGRAGVELEAERIVGVGSVCRRADARAILRPLGELGLRIHAFGVKGDTLAACSDVIASADSLAWSVAARKNPPLAECSHKRCNNCPRYALAWRRRLLDRLGQGRLFGEVPCPAAV